MNSFFIFIQFKNFKFVYIHFNYLISETIQTIAMQEKILQEIKDWKSLHKPQSYFKMYEIIYKKYQNFIDNFIPNEIINGTFQQKIYYIEHNIKEVVKCPICNNNIVWNKGYSITCSKSCNIKKRWQDGIMDDASKKSKDTFKSKYGKGTDGNKIINEKKKQTSIKKNGYEHHTKDPKYKEKMESYYLQEYGISNPSQTNKSKEKIKQFWIDLEKNNTKKEFVDSRYEKYVESIVSKYNVNNIFLIPSVKSKIKTKLIENYGVDTPFKSDVIRNRAIDTNLKRYNVTNAMQNYDIQKKHLISCLEYDIFVYPSGKEVKIQGDNKLALTELLLSYNEDDLFVEFECPIIDYKINNETHKYRPDIYIKSINTIIEVKSIYTFLGSFEINYKKYLATIQKGYKYEFWIYTNQKDKIVFNFKNNPLLKYFNGDDKILYGDKFLYLPEKNTMFLYLNINENLDKNYLYNLKNHLLQLNNSKINLVTIYSDVFDKKSDIIESRINNINGKSFKRQARKCKIKILNSVETKQFLIENHIQSYVPSKINLGLFENDELLAVMTFGKLRKSMGRNSIDGNYELLRFCSKKNYNVIGSASKLLQYFIKNYNPIQIISYADRNWSNGNVYEKIGMKLVSKNLPGYFYVKDGIRYNRWNFRKDALVDKGYDKDKTENEIMTELGYKVLQDSGQLVYVMDIL